jgi:hypothetical protein
MRRAALNISSSKYSSLFQMNMLPPKMMCDLITQTNLPNIKSNYFVNTIIIFNFSYYTNISLTVTFVNHLTLRRAFLCFSPKNYLHKSCTIFHIDLYVFNIPMEVPNGTNKLNHVKRLAVF